jgi:glycosyltransferase involved in cell wall biosynthesis
VLEKQGEIALRMRYSPSHRFADSDIRWCDVAVFCRSSEPADLLHLYELRRLNKRIIYDIDDNFEAIPLTTEIGVYHRAAFRLHAMKRFFELADAVRVYSEAMRQLALAYGGKCQRYLAYFDADLVSGLARRSRKDVVSLAYPTGRLDDPRLEEMFYGALGHVLQKYGSRVQLHLWTKEVPEQLKGFTNIRRHAGTRNYARFVRAFYTEGFDIGLAPLVDELFFHSKSNNKYREYGGCGVAGIYSNQPPYNDSVRHGVTGLLCDQGAEAWIDALEMLIEDAGLRQRIANAANEDVLSHYRFEDYVTCFRTLIRTVVDLPEQECDWLPPKPPPQPLLRRYGRARFSAVYIGRSDDPREVRDEGEATTYEQCRAAVQLLGGNCFPRQNCFGAITHSAMIRESDIVVVLVQDVAELREVRYIIPFARTLVVDVATPVLNKDEVLDAMRQWQTHRPISIISLASQKEWFLGLGVAFLQHALIDDQCTTIDSHFQLKGRMAAYMDVLEHHIRFRKRLKRRRWFRTTRETISGRVRRRWDNYKARAHAATVFWLWRLGVRWF